MISNAPAPRWRRLMWSAGRSRQFAGQFAGQFTGQLAGLAALGLLAITLARAPLAWEVAAIVGVTATALVLVSPAIGLAAVGLLIPFGGLAPLLSMLNSCALGVAVVNIDNGFGAAAYAHTILKQICREG